jgi:hypothetical protein
MSPTIERSPGVVSLHRLVVVASPLIAPLSRPLVLSLSSHCAALLPSNRAGSWLLHRLSSRRHLILSSTSHCTTLLLSNCAGWLLCRLSLRRRLVLSSSSYCATLLLTNRAGWLLCCLSSHVLEKGLEEDLLPMPNFTERHDKDRAVVPPTSLVAPVTMAVVVPHHPGCRTLSSGWASPSRHHCPCHRP